MSKKVLFCATVDYHFKAFHLPYMKWFQEQGWEVHVAANGDMELPYVDRKYNIPIQRSPFHIKNIKAYKELKKLIDNNNYKIIHCHTPVGGVLARLAAREARKRGTKVLYTAHGFHFCKGAPLFNWIIYYPIEKALAHYTDCLIVINSEDYNLAINHHFKACRVEHVHGVGVDLEKFRPISNDLKNELRKKHGYTLTEFLLFYAAELNVNKNQGLLIKAVAKLKDEIPEIKLLLAGRGPLEEKYYLLAKKYGVEDYVDFLGFRKDINELLSMSNVVVASSLREGLPVNIIEAMACGIPVVASDNRGHRELIKNGVNGFIYDPSKIDEIVNCILQIYKYSEISDIFRDANVSEVQKYSYHQVLNELTRIYRSFS
ncbi:glycosyltransferase family 4 protein [Geobacillus proteiniphilus]|uniref:Glycosyltransferase family 4 protein n=1 Tax=Geobacillus proteiniphilus TaxID=860353 RepID=A0ABY9ME95_9BACL|nr:glycosyltransferase family 4 protein [Geobacillus proteiniphilus]WMJ16347.1 glycosyltransferase family 4 protein [Geobacillus proteiniphilus]